MSMEMRGSNVSLKVIEQEHKKVGAIIVVSKTSSVGETPRATVIGIGPDVNLVQPGQMVLLSMGSGNELTVKGEKLLIVDQKEILAIIED